MEKNLFLDVMKYSENLIIFGILPKYNLLYVLSLGIKMRKKCHAFEYPTIDIFIYKHSVFVLIKVLVYKQF